MVVSALLLVGTDLPVPDRADRLHPERRHRPAQRPDRGHSGHRLRSDGGAPEGSHGHPRRRPERRLVHVERRRVRRRTAQRRPEAAHGAQADGRPGHRGAAAEVRARAGRPRGAVEPARDPDRRDDVARPVSVLAAGSGHRGVVPRGAGIRDRAAQRARAAGRQLGSPDQEPGAGRRRSTASRSRRSA